MPSLFDDRNNDFAIVSRVKVTAPDTAVSWKVNTTKTISFTHNYPTPHTFDIAIDRDGDLDCEELITAKTANSTTASYNWMVSGPTGAANRICVASQTDLIGTDISDVAFTIAP